MHFKTMQLQCDAKGRARVESRCVIIKLASHRIDRVTFTSAGICGIEMKNAAKRPLDYWDV